jgi:hypothetical protein
MKDEKFDEILDAMREETASQAEMKEAREKVWKRMTAGQACAEFRTEFADYRAGRLAEARQVLMADHLSRCAECRMAMDQLDGLRKVVEMPVTPRKNWLPAGQWRKWAVAAGLAALALFAGRDRIDSALAPSGARATVALVNGGLYTVAGRAIGAGTQLGEGEAVRTAAGARAVLRLADGSMVEMNERTELAVKAAWSGQTVALERGDVIVTAAKQKRGGLHVATADAEATVKGTIFTVRTGLAGSMVGVVEGSVEVKQPGRESVLKPGEHTATSAALDGVEVREAVAWSADAEKYYTLLAELANIGKKLAELPGPAPRTQSNLVARMPAGTVVYGAMPNIGGTVGEAVSMIERRSEDSEVLREWWESESGKNVRKMLVHVQGITPLLGDEVVFMLVTDAAQPGEKLPFVVSEISAGKQAALEEAIAKAVPAGDMNHAYKIVGNLLMVSDSQRSLAALMPKLGTGAGSAFAAQVTGRYATGVSWMLALDVAGFNPEMSETTSASVVGIERVNYLFFEQKRVNGADELKASIGFKSARTGVASWLAEPGASGSSEYITPDAFLALSASAKNPRQAFDELVELVSKTDAKFAGELNKFETATGVSVAGDLASALGPDFTVIVQTPRIPIPSWVAAIEVYRPELIDAAAERFVTAFNAKLGAEQQQFKVTLDSSEANGRQWKTLTATGAKSPVMWTYDRGYMIVTMDRAVGERAIAARASGYPLVRSASFRAQMPGVGAVHHSGFFWLNTKGALADLSGLTSNAVIKQMLENEEPVLVVFDGSTERIEAASRTRMTSLVFDLLLASGAGKAEAAQVKAN